jgi:TRAP-type C4-dicarboxylate transport system permease small subunit
MWPYNIAEFTLVYVFFFALGPALESGHHIRVDLFDNVVPRLIRPAVPYIAAALTIGFGVVFCWQLWRSTSRAFGDDRLAVAAIAVPLKWVYIIGPIGTIQFILTALAELGRAYWHIADEPPALATVPEV